MLSLETETMISCDEGLGLNHNNSYSLKRRLFSDSFLAANREVLGSIPGATKFSA
jgi:hypothetical protein